MKRTLVVGIVALLAPIASAQIEITEWMYSGADGEFIEFTNVGSNSVDMTGWSFDDSSQTPGTVDLSAFGVVQAGESVILTEAVAVDFAAAWGLSGVDIIGELSANLGRNDQLNLYDASDNLVDVLSYGDEDYPGSPRTQNQSCNIPESGFSATEAQTSWVLSAVGDEYGARTSSGGDVASPGRIVGYSLCDYDADGDVDLKDFGAFSACMTGSGVLYDPLPAACGLTPDLDGFIAADADRDSDVDLVDFAAMVECISGPDTPSDPSCGYIEAPPTSTLITLNGTSIDVNGTGVTVDGTTATITSAGSYTIIGTLNDGQIVVNTGGAVEITLDGVNITNSTNAPIAVLSADSVAFILEDQSTNILTDAATYVFDDPEEDEPNACLFSKDSMLISGTGTLTVHGNYNDGIASKDDLVIASGTINVDAVDDGIRGKDYLQINGGDTTVVCGGDGLKSDEDEDPALGFIAIEAGSIDVTAGGDGITGETAVYVSGGTIDVTSGGGHNAALPEDLSAKGIKGLVEVVIDGGTINLDCADDGVHSNSNGFINGGTITIATGDDGIHTDESLEINGGSITVTDSYEGIESTIITINDGTIKVVASDDGINGAGGVDGSGGPPPPPPASSGDYFLYVNGGYIAVDASGDGVDVNGDIEMTGGTLVVHGPTSNGNGSIDYDGTFIISGGVLIAAGSNGQGGGAPRTPSTSSPQRSIKINYSSNKSAGTVSHLQASSNGADVFTFAPAKTYRSIIFSSPALTVGGSFTLWSGGSSTGTEFEGLFEGGTYSPGTQTNTITTSSVVTTVNAP